MGCAKLRGLVRYLTLVLTLAGAALGGVSCGGKSLTPTTQDAGAPAAPASSQDAGGHDAGRAPKEHRASRAQCRTERAAVTPASDGCPVNALHCAQDSDCSAGSNGRCFDVGLCPSDCSYDDCSQDSDCAHRTPCFCRPSATDKNYCFTLSNCSVDADCGDGGYCSPSLITSSCICENESCAEGYFCHTARDGCLDDSDCQAGQSCAFDRSAQQFSCHSCLVRP